MGLGREMLEKEARKAGINLSKAEKDGHLSTLVNSLAAGSVDELMASIGYARFTTKQVKRLQAIVSPPEILERRCRGYGRLPTASARSRARLLRPRRAASPCAAWTT